MSYTFLANVDDEGAWIFEDYDALREASNAVKGKAITVTMDVRKQKRSHAQLRWLWGIAYPLIAEHLGYDRHEHQRLHDDLLCVRFGTVAETPLLPNAPPRIVPKTTTSDLSTVEMSDYMEWLARYAAEHFDVILPFPDDPDTYERQTRER